MKAASHPALTAEGITVKFSDGNGSSLLANNNVSLSLKEGEVLGIVGESGSGKSTLALVLLNLLAPTEGQVLLDGTPLKTMSRKELARRIQPVFQDPYASLNPIRSIEDIVAQPLAVHRVGNRKEQLRAAHEMLDAVGLPKRVRSHVSRQLSGGQRQRVAIARALMLRPRILICDEPTSALDVSIQAQILNLLQDLQRDFNLSIIVVSHNLAVIRYLCSSIMVMKDGTTVERGDCAAVFDHPQHPYTVKLLASVLEARVGLGRA